MKRGILRVTYGKPDRGRYRTLDKRHLAPDILDEARKVHSRGKALIIEVHYFAGPEEGWQRLWYWRSKELTSCSK